MGTLYIGGQGTGKTTALARHLVDYMTKYPNRAIFVLDWSGSITDAMLAIIMAVKDNERLISRVIYDQLGNAEWVTPMPEFSLLYGGTYEDQIQRVTTNIERLNAKLVELNPTMGGTAIKHILPHIFRLLTAMTRDEVDPSETWQITEANRLLDDVPLLRKALAKYGSKVPETEWYLKNKYLGPEIKASEREMRTYTLSGLLSVTSIREIKARLGYYRPGWTPKEVIDGGKLVLIDGAKLIGQEQSLSYLFHQAFSLILAELKRRRPANPDDEPVSLVLDEVKSLLEIPGMAPEIASLAPQYRSRKLQLYVVLQELSQMSDELRPHIWSLGNVVCFGMFNFDEAFELAQQLFPYESLLQRVPATNSLHHPIMENDRGQFLLIADWLQRLNKRECVMRRQVAEQERDKYVRHVPKTLDVNLDNNQARLNELKEELIKQRGVRIHDALELINRRHQQPQSPPKTPPTVH